MLDYMIITYQDTRKITGKMLFEVGKYLIRN